MLHDRDEVQVRVAQLSGEVVMDSALPRSALVGDVLAQLAELGGPARLRLLLGERQLGSREALLDLIPGGPAEDRGGGPRLELQLVRVSRTFEPCAPSEHDCAFKVLLVGESGVGKSCLVRRFVDGTFAECQLPLAFGMDCSSTGLLVDGLAPSEARKVRLQIWDAPGRVRFPALVQQWAQYCDAVVLLFDVCGRESFRGVPAWLDEAERCVPRGTPVCVVGNKIDAAESRVVSAGEARALAEARGVRYYETSAKTGAGVERPFHASVEALLDRAERPPPELAPPPRAWSLCAVA